MEKVLFLVNGQQVDGLGRIDGKEPAPTTVDGAADVEALKKQLADAQKAMEDAQAALEATGNPDSPDQRNMAQLKEALDAKGVSYDARANKAALQKLAADNGV